MGHREKIAYLEAIRRRYAHSNRKNKKLILDEFCAVCKFNRKYAIRLLNQPPKHQKRKRGRKSRYNDPQFLTVLLCIWKASDFMCSSRFKAVIPAWLPFYEQSYDRVTDEIRALLLAISRATLDRVLRPLRAKYRKGLCGTKPGSLLRIQIPVRTENWDITQPGFMEADTVAHCGNSLAGQFVWSLTMTDIHTAWTECRAVWNKGSCDVIAQVKDIELRLPFPLKGFDCDNGSEFLNYHLVRYFTDREVPVNFTRSRPYKKNDNAHVEQKNWAHPRHLLGYDRLEDPNLIARINDLYSTEWSFYQNYFCPSLKLLSKTRIGSKYKKKYDQPKTPFQRVTESDSIPDSTKNQLARIKENLNPFQLKKTIEQKLKTIFKNISVTSFVRQRI